MVEKGYKSSQRYPNDFDGIIGAATAMYFPVIELGQGWPNIAMAQHNHWPSPCAFRLIQNDTLPPCDDLDGKVDGVIS